MSRQSLRHVLAGGHLTIDETDMLVFEIMQGTWAEDDVAALLAALHRRGETVEEIAGAARAMRRHMTQIAHHRDDAIDIVGTGGDGSGTFNISTAAALVTAAAGVPVAKHGNRKITSRSGSADVLDKLGVNVAAEVAVVSRCLDELGICFCFAPLLHTAMRHVAPVRQRLPHPTIFNILGPLANPASTRRQVLGVGRPELRTIMAEAMLLLETDRAAIVHGAGNLDEVSLAGPTEVLIVNTATGGTKTTVEHVVWSPEDFDLQPVPTDALQVDDAEQSAALIRAVLSGQPGPARDIVLANTAAALWLADKADTLAAGVRRAAEAIDSGAAADLLARLAELSHHPTG